MRSILKHPHHPDLQYHHGPEPFPFASSSTVQVSTHVHFPPTPTLTSIFMTHSSAVYDRTPAEVPDNTCALPGRHEREFVDTPHPRPRRRWDREPSGSQGGYFQFRGPEPSDSEDSDAVRTPPESLCGHPVAVRFNSTNVMLPYAPTHEDIESALFFLPHTSNAPLKRKGTRRSKDPRRESADGRIPHQNGFSAPTLDFEGCLGGF